MVTCYLGSIEPKIERYYKKTTICSMTLTSSLWVNSIKAWAALIEIHKHNFLFDVPKKGNSSNSQVLMGVLTTKPSLASAPQRDSSPLKIGPWTKK